MEQGMTDLTAIVISFNTIAMLRECLTSVFENCDDLNLEVFVVDNASSDGSSEMVAREFPQVHLIRNVDNRGFAAANNQAISIGGGRYMLLLNSDTLVLGNVLSDSVKYMNENSDVGVLGCRVLNPDRTLQLTCSQVPSVGNLFLQLSGLSRLDWPVFFGRYQMKHWERRSERDVDVVSGCYLLARSSAIQQVGLLDESFFFFAEETDWCRRFKQAGWRVVFAPVGEIIHYGSASALSLGHKRDLLLTTGLVRYHRKHGGVFMALIVWAMLFAFNVSRCLYWTGTSLFLRTTKSSERRKHFWGIVRNYASTWPTQ